LTFPQGRTSLPPFSLHTCFLVFSPSLVIFFDATFQPLAARNPTNQGERQLMLDRQSHQALVFPETAWRLQQAS
jgi:hypothetical protein